MAGQPDTLLLRYDMTTTGGVMGKRTKWLLVLLVFLAIGFAGEKKEGGAALISIAALAFVVWLAWRAFVFLSLLLKPVRRAIKPIVDPINTHVDATLRRSGLGKIADVGAGMQAAVDRAVDATQNHIDNGIVPTPETHVKCPDCRELVFHDAKICRYCRCVLVPQ